MRRRVIAGKWKMYKDARGHSRRLSPRYLPLVTGAKHGEMLSPAVHSDLPQRSNATKAQASPSPAKTSPGARRCIQREVSAPHAAEAGCRYVIIGHSERAKLFRDGGQCRQEDLCAGQRPYPLFDGRNTKTETLALPNRCSAANSPEARRVEPPKSSPVSGCIETGLGHRHGPTRPRKLPPHS